MSLRLVFGEGKGGEVTSKCKVSSCRSLPSFERARRESGGGKETQQQEKTGIETRRAKGGSELRY